MASPAPVAWVTKLGYSGDLLPHFVTLAGSGRCGVCGVGRRVVEGCAGGHDGS